MIWKTKPDFEGLWHTPLYLELLSLWHSIFGDGIEVSRSFGTFCGLATLAILWRHTKSVLLLFLLAVHPYFIQSSLLLDIDNTLLIPVLMLWTIVVQRWLDESKGGWKLTFTASGIFAIAMMVKELTPLIALPVWTFCAFLKGSKKHLLQAAVGCLIGMGFFLILLKGWTLWRGFDFLDPLALTFEKLGQRPGGVPWAKWGLLKYMFLTYLPFLWVGIPAIVIAALFFPKSKLNWQDLRKVPVGIWLGLGILCAYTWIVQAAYYFPKYTSPVLTLVVLGISQWGIASFGAQKIFNRRMLVWGGVVYLLALVPLFDPLLLIRDRREFEILTLVLHFLSIAAPTVLILGLSKSRQNTSAVVLLIFYLLGLSNSQAFRQHSTGYLYGEAGMARVGTEVALIGKSVLTPNFDLYWNNREIAQGFFLDRSVPSQIQVDHRSFRLGKPKKINNIEGYVLLSRTYGSEAVRENSYWKSQVSVLFNCHKIYENFEWWWNDDNCT